MSELRKFTNPYQDVGKSKPEDKSLEESIGNQRTEFGVEIQYVIVLPKPYPRETEEKYP
jgi:hypothetical protein